jgi:hypothetical protein
MIAFPDRDQARLSMKRSFKHKTLLYYKRDALSQEQGRTILHYGGGRIRGIEKRKRKIKVFLLEGGEPTTRQPKQAELLASFQYLNKREPIWYTLRKDEHHIFGY